MKVRDIYKLIKSTSAKKSIGSDFIKLMLDEVERRMKEKK